MYRRNVTDFPGGLREALKQSAPFYVPAGVYYLKEEDGQIVLDASVDMAGVGADTEIRVRGKPLVGGKGLARFAGFKITGAVTSDALLTYTSAVGDLPGFEMTGVNASKARWIDLSDYLDDQTIPLTIDRAIAKGLTGTGQHTPINLQGAVRYHELEDIAISDFTRFGIVVGSGRRSGQLRMQNGSLKNVSVIDGTSIAGTNNGGIWHGGRNVDMDGIYIEDVPVINSDCEGLYTKVEGLTIRDLTLVRAAGSQGSFAPKGAHLPSETWEIDGRDVDAENVVIDFTGATGAKTAVWCQNWGTCSFRKVKVIGGAGVGFRMHANCDGAYELREWDVWDHNVPDAPTNPGFVYRQGVGTLHVQDCTLPTRDGLPWWRQSGPVMTESHNRLAIAA